MPKRSLRSARRDRRSPAAPEPGRPRPASRARADRRLWHAGLIVVAVIVVYLDAVPNAFLWDDIPLVVSDPWIKSWSGLRHVFTASLLDAGSTRYYRPLQALTYAVDYRLWGLDPMGFRLTNVGLHASVALLLYRLGRTLLGSPMAALFAALAFAVHPIHTEAVAYVAGRSDPLAAVFMLASLVCVAERRSRALSVVCFALALLAREAAMILPLLVVLVELATSRGEVRDPRDRLRAALVGLAPYVAVLVLYLAVRAAALEGAPATSATGGVALPFRLLTMLEVVVRYLALLVVPIGQHMERLVVPASSAFAPATLAAALVVGALVAVAMRLRARAWPIAFGIAWFLVALVPVSGIVPLATFMAEHWLYVPSMGLFLAAGWGLDRLAAHGSRWPVAAAIGAIVVYGALTARRNLDWRDDMTLFRATLPFAPQSVRVHAGLGLAHKQRGELGQAIAAYEQAMRLNPSAWQAVVIHNNLGNIYRQQGRLDEALAELQAGLALDPSHVDSLNNLAATLLAIGRGAEAEAALETALRVAPSSAAAHVNIAVVYAGRNDLERARAELLTAVQLDPENADAHNNLGTLHLRAGELALAEQEYGIALRLNPGSPQIRGNLDEVRRRRSGLP